MIVNLALESHEDWLMERKNRIGGSDAAAVIGLNPYMTNQDLFWFKTGEKEQEDIGDKWYVKYGIDAEPLLRKLFALDFPQYEVFYGENNLFVNEKYPFAHASLDGWLKDADGNDGVLEIKTTNIVSSAQKALWNERIPDNYYAQILHNMAVMDAEFAILKAQLKWEINENVFMQTKHYTFTRAEVSEDIAYLMDEEKKFWVKKEAGELPALILPSI